jgi:signal transduction histidine kinase
MRHPRWYRLGADPQWDCGIAARPRAPPGRVGGSRDNDATSRRHSGDTAGTSHGVRSAAQIAHPGRPTIDDEGVAHGEDAAKPGAIGRRMLDFAREVVSTLDVERVLQRVLEMARDITDAQYAALGVLDQPHGELERFLTLGIDEETRHRLGPLPRGHGVLGELIRHPRPLRLEDVSAHPRSYGFPVGHPRMATFLGVPILIDGVAFGNLYLAEKRSGAFDEADEEAVITLAGWAAVAIENARIHQRVARQRDELEQNVAALSAMMDIALALGGETDMDAMLELVVKRARALVSAAGMVVALVDGADATIAATAGELPPQLRGTALALDRTPMGEAVISRRPVPMDDIAIERLLKSLGGAVDGMRADAGLVVPLLFRDRPLGVLVAVNRLVDGPEFGPRDEQLLQAFSTTAAAALATGRSVAVDLVQNRVLAAEGERNRWARELHDETLQALAMLRMTLSGAARKGGADVLQAAVETALEHIDVQITSLRGLIAEVRPTALDDMGVGAALEAFVERAASLGGGEIELSVDLDYEAGRNPRRHAPALEAALYRITQEAITNAAKHAGAARIHVGLREVDGVIEATVEDDGSGFDPESTQSGFGLTGMRERTELAGGTLEVVSSPGVGTRVVARLPAGRRVEAAV